MQRFLDVAEDERWKQVLKGQEMTKAKLIRPTLSVFRPSAGSKEGLPGAEERREVGIGWDMMAKWAEVRYRKGSRSERMVEGCWAKARQNRANCFGYVPFWPS